MSSVLEQTLQIALQETTALGVFAALTVGVVGMSIRGIVGSMVSGDGSEADAPTRPASTEGNGSPRIVSDGGGRPDPRREDETEEEFENRLNNLEAEVDDLSSTVQAVQHENEQIAENVEEVNGHLQRLIDLSGSLARGMNPFSSGNDEPADAFQQNAEPKDAFQRNAQREQADDRHSRRPDAGDRRGRNPDTVDSDGEAVNRHSPVQHDKVETIPGGTGDAEEFDRMEEEVEELDTLSFSDDVGENFGETEEKDLGKEEVISGPEPAPTGDAIGDGGTLIETKEEELDITPGSVSEPTVEEATDTEESEPAPVVESGFEFGAKALGDEDDATESPEPELDEPTADDDETLVADGETQMGDDEVSEDFGETFEEADTPDEAPASEDKADSDTESMPLDDQTEAELAAAEAAFAAEFDAEDELSLDIEASEADLSEEEPGEPDPTSDVSSLRSELEGAPTTTPAETDTQTREADAQVGKTDSPTTEQESELEPDTSTELSESDTSTEPSDAESDTSTEANAGTKEDEQTAPTPTVSGIDSETERSLSQHVTIRGDGKPYVESLPEGYSAELLVVEWLETLVDDIGVHGTARAIEYYQSLEWITADVADQLDAYLHAFESGDADTLGVDQHLRSLEYVDELARSEDDE